MAVSFYNPGLTFHQSTTCDGRLIYRVCCFDRRKYGILTDSSRTLCPILHECLPQFMRKCVLTNTELTVSRTATLFNLLRIPTDSIFLKSAVLKRFLCLQLSHHEYDFPSSELNPLTAIRSMPVRSVYRPTACE